MTDATPGGRGDALLMAARRDAAARGSDVVGAEHLLLQVLALPVAQESMRAAGVAPEEISQRVESGIRPGRQGRPEDQLQLSSQGRRLVSSAEREAKGREAELQPVHYLLAAFAEPRGSLARALAETGASLPKLRESVYAATGLEPLPRESRRKKQGAETAPAQPAAPEASPREPTPAAVSQASSAPARESRRKQERPRRERAPQATPAAPPEAPVQDPVPAPPRPVRKQPLRHLRRDPDAWGPIWRRILLLAVPVAIWADLSGQGPLLVFLLACCGVVPLAGFMGDATEHLACRTGPTIGGLLNATFGNAAELIIGLAALRAGLTTLVKLSITGSILGNLLLIMGLSLVAGGLRSRELRFSRTATGMSAGMLAAAVVGLVFPALFHATHAGPSSLAELRLSEGVAVVLIITYALGLVFTLHTHRWLLGGDPHERPVLTWGLGKSVGVLVVATAGVAVLSELLVHAAESAGNALGLGEAFLGLIIIPLIGNAAEHASAIMMARRGKMDLALQIAYGSSTQIALLVAPVLVFAGVLMGQEMNLVFTPFEVMALALAVVVTAMGTTDGESHWFEGVMLLAVYALVGIAAVFV